MTPYICSHRLDLECSFALVQSMEASGTKVMRQISEWKHVFKLDPEREIGDGDLERLCASGTDALLIGGSSGVTFDNTSGLLRRIRRMSRIPCALEVTSAEAAVPGFDLYLIPMVLNTDDARWILAEQHRAVRRFGDLIPWEQVVAEGYVILNGNCTAARLTGARADLDEESVIAYARMAERLFRLPVFYMEYSGAFGDMELVSRVAKELASTRLFYGGGIDGEEKAKLAAEAAPTIVVGNIIYEDMERALETVVSGKFRNP